MWKKSLSFFLVQWAFWKSLIVGNPPFKEIVELFMKTRMEEYRV